MVLKVWARYWAYYVGRDTQIRLLLSVETDVASVSLNLKKCGKVTEYFTAVRGIQNDKVMLNQWHVREIN